LGVTRAGGAIGFLPGFAKAGGPAKVGTAVAVATARKKIWWMHRMASVPRGGRRPEEGRPSSRRGFERTGDTQGQDCVIPEVITARMVAFGEYECDDSASTLKMRDYKDATDLVAHTLRGEGFDASEDGTGRGTPLVPVAFDTTQISSPANYSNPQPGDPCHPLAAGAHPPAVAFQSNAGSQAGDVFEELSPTLRVQKTGGGGMPAVAFQIMTPTMQVRRLTPRECERLQGFPDDHTLIPWRGKTAPDGPRYKALGNSMAVPVMRWIGQRIADLNRDHPTTPNPPTYEKDPRTANERF
jgi:DNA (cytosine-5)-methyltransferase 1